MNEQETIKFILENSSEPVIKNPILQAALREPRPMAHGGRVGYKPIVFSSDLSDCLTS